MIFYVDYRQFFFGKPRLYYYQEPFFLFYTDDRNITVKKYLL